MYDVPNVNFDLHMNPVNEEGTNITGISKETSQTTGIMGTNAIGVEIGFQIDVGDPLLAESEADIGENSSDQ